MLNVMANNCVNTATTNSHVQQVHSCLCLAVFPCSANRAGFMIKNSRKLGRSALVNGMCNFKDGIGAATAATVPNAELDCLYERLRRVVA